MRFLTFRGYLAALAVALLVMGWWGVSQVQAQESLMRHAVGRLAVTIAPADPEMVEAGLGLTRYILAKGDDGRFGLTLFLSLREGKKTT